MSNDTHFNGALLMDNGKMWRYFQEGNYSRADGEVICVRCDKLYKRHPELVNPETGETMATFHIICKNVLVKT